MLLGLVQSYSRALKSHPLPTKAVTGGVLYSGGDLLCQWIESKGERNVIKEHQKDLKKEKNEIKKDKLTLKQQKTQIKQTAPFSEEREKAKMEYNQAKNEIKQAENALKKAKFEAKTELKEHIFVWDKKRTAKMATFGAFFSAPCAHVWYVKILGNKIPGVDSKSVIKKVILDTAIYGPVTNSLFLAYIEGIQGGTVASFKERMEKDFLKIFAADLAVWPFAMFINFKYVNIHWQVPFVSLVTVGWSAFLSWMGNN